MSIVIKSNQIFNGESPTVEQILTTQDAVYSAYLARVVADGGSIVSESKVRDAITFMFDSNLYGRIGVSASPYYGVKLDANGGILKLYSIYGEDLVGRAVGSGELPKIVSNFVDFNPTTHGTVNGGILTTAVKKSWSVTGRMAYAVATKEHIAATLLPLAALSSHGDFALNGDVLSLLAGSATNGTIGLRTNNAAYGGGTAILNLVNANNPQYSVVAGSDFITKSTFLYTSGALQGSNNPNNIPEQVHKNAHYMDFGGAIRSSGNTLNGFKASALWFLADCTIAQRIATNLFLRTNYY